MFIFQNLYCIFSVLMLLMLFGVRTDDVTIELDLAFDNQICEVMGGGDLGMILLVVIRKALDQV